MGAAADHDLKRFLKPYYVLNVLTLASYGLFRLWFYTTAAPGGHRDMTLRGWVRRTPGASGGCWYMP